MTNKESFILMVEDLLDAVDINDMPEGAIKYFNELKEEKTTNQKTELTENGAKVLKFMQENYQKYNNIFKAKEIGEGLFTSGRSVSGSMKKLIAEGFVEKIGGDPVSYAITDKGKEKDLSNI